MQDRIVKVVFTLWTFDVPTLSYRTRYVYEFRRDGRCLARKYEKGLLRPRETRGPEMVPPERFEAFCRDLEECVLTAEEPRKIIDDCWGTLKIYRMFGRVETMPREYGNARRDVQWIVDDFISSVPGLDFFD